MIQLMLFIETILIVFWIDIEYKTTNFTYLPQTQTHYSTHYTLDVVGNPILILKGMPENKKFVVWNESSLKYEMLSYFPNIHLMEEFFQDRIEDNGKFKTHFLNHMREAHGDYIGAIITKEEFIKAINNPPPIQEPNSFIVLNQSY